MKKLQFLVLILMAALYAEAQELKEAEVPAAVANSFHKLFPDVKGIDWTMEDGNFEAEYKVNHMEASASFDAKGNLLETEKEIDVKSLPAGVAAYVSKNYPGESITEAAEITDNKGRKMYEAEIKDKDLIFDAKGTFLKVE
jgi:hypothetical protein